MKSRGKANGAAAFYGSVGPWLTRQEVITMLQSRGYGVTARNLIHWQTVGAIPYPDRRRHEGATRAVYPFEFIDDIIRLRSMQAEGKKLREIRGCLRRRHGLVHPLRSEDV